ncbi:glyoxalase superfamily protein [Jannaschia sp. CCS1]|uniref:glyoxalase superfamily protein n=1 Tax=Jannaschia sp. (strain CCS1) TaxID=290400 RepID=UPI000053C7EC|nr:glyoxalase superfamily protein [Jannaschia sp. CCS1]ABD53626.1 hypothetical protein Jann_0709 [Jannaschia sp. CCS1]
MTLTIERAKARAKTLRAGLEALDRTITHGQALDLIAKLEGLADWNVLSARLQPEVPIGPLPNGWTRAGDQPERFEMGQAMRADTPAAAIRLKPGEEAGSAFATLMQSVDATVYRGQRMMLTGRLAADAVTGGVTIWMRADDIGKRMVAFDNLEEAGPDKGPVTGTSDWVERRIILDIPEVAQTLNFGFYLRGRGTAWCAGVALDHAPDGTDVTRTGTSPAPAPQNLSFE